MVEAWIKLIQENRDAAQSLRHHRYYRSCVSRAYYAMYSAITARVIQQKMGPFGSRPNPGHEKALNVFRESVLDQKKGDPANNRRLIRASKNVKRCRIQADYEPNIMIDRELAIQILRDADQVIDACKVR